LENANTILPAHLMRLSVLKGMDFLKHFLCPCGEF
jgi:hypothetical protein